MKGTATAASLWGTGVTGAAVGLGAYKVAIVIAVLTKLTLFLLPRIKPAEEQKDGEFESGGKNDVPNEVKKSNAIQAKGSK